MISATIGIPGAGKSFWAVKTALDYIASGGVVFTNIKFTGLVDTGVQSDPQRSFFRYAIASDSPVVKYLKKSMRWDYCEGQYSYIPLDQYDENFLKLLPHGSFQKPILLLLDEVNLWFDSLDRGKLSNDAKYREMFDFLRLSRHYHIDVVFLLQDFNTLNSRLRGLCGKIVRCQDMQKMKVKGIPIPFPFRWFLWQEFDSKGKNIVSSKTWFKDPDLFACYDSFCSVGESGLSDISVRTDFNQQSQKKGKGKMSFFERVLIYSALGLMAWRVWSFPSGAGQVSGLPVAVVPVASSNGFQRSAASVSVPLRGFSAVERQSDFKMGRFSYAEYGGERYLFIDGLRILKGREYKEGVCVSYGEDFAYFVSGRGVCWVYRDERPLESYVDVAGGVADGVE